MIFPWNSHVFQHVFAPGCVVATSATASSAALSPTIVASVLADENLQKKVVQQMKIDLMWLDREIYLMWI